MEFLGIGPFELLLILFLVLLVFGPKDMAQAGRNLGRWIYQLRNSDVWRSLMQTGSQLRELPKQIIQEAELEELSKALPTKEEIGLIGDLGQIELPPLAPKNQAPANPKLASWSGETQSVPRPEAPTAGSDYLSAWSQPDRKSRGPGFPKPTQANSQPAETADDPE